MLARTESTAVSDVPFRGEAAIAPKFDGSISDSGFVGTRTG
jgi:hypothetical protein